MFFLNAAKNSNLKESEPKIQLQLTEASSSWKLLPGTGDRLADEVTATSPFSDVKRILEASDVAHKSDLKLEKLFRIFGRPSCFCACCILLTPALTILHMTLCCRSNEQRVPRFQ